MTNADQMKAIENLKGAALREKFRDVVGTETHSKDKTYLVRKIVQALQAGSSEAVAPAPKPEAEANADQKDKKRTPGRGTPDASPKAAGPRDPRLPEPGTLLEREHDGKTIRVKVLEDGFEYRGKTYRSLSTVAREATGTVWNGFLFFHLKPYAKRTRKVA